MSSPSQAHTPRLLVVGGASSGKSTYRVQLYQRIEHESGELKLVKAVSDLTAIEGDVELLVQGLQPRHTNVDTYHSTTFTIEERTGRRFVLEFPDYGGEQIHRMALSNFIPEPWIKRAQDSDRWLFFIRIDDVRPAKSFMTEPVAVDARSPAPTTNEPASNASSEFEAIETLQRLLFVRSSSLQRPLSSPRLLVLLSCWDELPQSERNSPPPELLEKRAPLFYRFCTSTWQTNSLLIQGLSSTEQRLPEEQPNEDFARKGPHHFGYVVNLRGERNKDLTSPLSWLMQ